MTAPPHTEDALRAALAGATTTARIAEILAGRGIADPWQVMRVLTASRFPGLDVLRYLPAATATIAAARPVQRTQARAALERRWTLRHYSGSDRSTPPAHDEIRSALALQGGAGARASHTNAADWRAVGNVAFTFHLLAVDGRVPGRRWLGDCHWYAEWDPATIADCWVSGDLLAALNGAADTAAAEQVFTARRGGILRGSGADVRTALALALGAGGASPDELVRRLDELVGGTLEVKVPGSLRVAAWHPVTRS